MAEHASLPLRLWPKRPWRKHDISLTKKEPEIGEVGASQDSWTLNSTWHTKPVSIVLSMNCKVGSDCVGLMCHLPITGSSLVSSTFPTDSYTWFVTFRYSPLKSASPGRPTQNWSPTFGNHPTWCDNVFFHIREKGAACSCDGELQFCSCNCLQLWILVISLSIDLCVVLYLVFPSNKHIVDPTDLTSL